jgi:hypothetical protein
MAAEEAAFARQIKEITDGLITALGAVGAQFKAAQERASEAREAAALFALYQELRRLDAPREGMSTTERQERQEEIRAQLSTAVAGYDVRYLAELATFGGWLADVAGKEWRKRP